MPLSRFSRFSDLGAYGVNYAGAAYLCASAFEYSTARPMNLAAASSIVLFVGFTLYGHKSDKVVMLGTLSSLPAPWLGIYDELRKLQPLSVAGATITTLGLSFLAASEFLSRRFKNSENLLYRNLLGQPRRLGGRLLMVSNAPIVLDKLMGGKWAEAAFFAGLTLGDYFFSRSQPLSAQNRKPHNNPEML